MRALLLLAAAGSALVAGVFFAFSSFVMRALARLPAADAVAAMNSINVTVITPSFMGAFLGTAVLCAVALVGVALAPGGMAAVAIVAAALAYLIGALGVTLAVNQPMNLRLARLGPEDACAWWPVYRRRWTRWNGVRAVAALAAAAGLVWASVNMPYMGII